MTVSPLRVIDTGVLTARQNLAFTAALAELHRAGEVPDTLRFQDFTPSAIVGRHQSLAREVDITRCREKGVETARRMTGGGAIYMGPGLLGWELVVQRGRVGGALDEIASRLCSGLAAGLSGLGIEARFRPRNDIEVGGRKISGTGGYVDGGTLVFQGTVLIDFDVADMADVLRLPAMKRDRHAVALLAERVASLKQLLGAAPERAAVTSAVVRGLGGAIGAVAEEGCVSEREQALAGELFRVEIGTDAFVAGDDFGEDRAGGDVLTGAASIPAGIVEVAIRLRPGADRAIERVLIRGDFFATPPRAMLDLEAALVGVPVIGAAEAARDFMARAGVDMLGGTADDVVRVIADTLGAGTREGYGR